MPIDIGDLKTAAEIEEEKADILVAKADILAASVESTPTDPNKYDAGQSVIGEIGEAFSEMAVAFYNIKDAFINFGKVLGVETQAIGTKMAVSITNIKDSMGNLTNKFKNMGDNLADTLK